MSVQIGCRLLLIVRRIDKAESSYFIAKLILNPYLRTILIQHQKYNPSKV